LPDHHSPEDEYFARLELEKAEALKAKLDAEAAAKAAIEQKALHWHRCGKCGTAMDTRLFRGVEVEVCPQCGAVLLDRGELERLAGEEHEGVLTALSALFGR
jgi:hypothetical protein